MKITVDTSALMNYLKDIEEKINEYKFILPSIVVEELDNLNKSDNFDKSYKARCALRFIEDYSDRFEYVICDNFVADLPNGWDKNKNDNKILSVAKKSYSALFCRDRNLKMKAKIINIDVIDFKKDVEKYFGFKEIMLSDEEMADFYEGKYNDFGLIDNQYLVISDKNGKNVDKFKYFGGNLTKLNKNYGFKSKFIDNVKAYDIYQELAIDSLKNDKFTLLTGHAGTAKSLLSLAYSLESIEKNKYDKLVIFTNPVKARGTTNLGFYSGNRTEKLLQNSIGAMLNSKMGGIIGVENLISREMLEIYPMGDIRGMEIQDKQILYITEAQNMTVDMAKLCLQRVADGAKIIFEGDINTQMDSIMFENGNNGILKIIDTFKGNECFSYVELQNIYRSEFAKIADKM